MAPTRVRSGSPSPSVEPTSKRLKTESKAPYHEGVSSKFAPNLFDAANIGRFKEEYKDSAPFKHAVVGQLFDSHLLKNVKDEILGQLSFSEKETDIYKVRQLFYQDIPRISYRM
jgi:prolyl 3-hydroxylase /prolyl 3,4-dihydroxylase